MPRVLILADDLSGAADCGIACVRAGLEAIVSLGLPTIEEWVDVVAVDADTRHLNVDAAAERMRHLVKAVALDPALLLFKKIDSTLRGHLGPELAAVLEARRAVLPRTVAVMAPAFPAHGRTTIEGTHFIHGVPVHESEMWKSEKINEEAYIPGILERSGLRCVALNLASVRSSRSLFFQKVFDAAESGDVILCDATTEDDLDAIAEAAVSLQGRAVWVGSAGLAHALPKAAGLILSEQGRASLFFETSGPILFVIGSASKTTRRQVAVLLASANIRGIIVPTDVLLEGSTSPQWDTFVAELQATVELEEDVILLCGSESEVDAIDRPRLSQSLAKITAILHGKVGALVASGGETARRVLDQWGVRKMQLHGELEEGVPISSVVVDGGRPLTVITKAGDFGQANTLLHCYEWLSKGGVSR